MPVQRQRNLMNRPAPPSPNARAGLGPDLRALRKARGLTLTELAVKVGRSVGFLSQVERDISDVSISDLRRIANALEIPLGWFFVHDDAPPDERGYVVRAHARRQLGTAESGLVEELLSPDLGGSFETILSTFAPGAELTAPQHRQTEEAGYVVAGELELWVGDRHFHLRAGDSFRFHDEPHRWRNSGGVPAVVVWIVSPPVY
jgi:transcriptional regulator with XRE-family HTH domain